jgi:hypothetical protein
VYEDLFKAAEEGSTKTEWEQQLEPEVLQDLEAFHEWLKKPEPEGDGKAESTAGAYKGYVAQALVKVAEGATWGQLSTDIRSAVNAFKRFLKTRGVDVTITDDEDEDEAPEAE